MPFPFSLAFDIKMMKEKFEGHERVFDVHTKKLNEAQSTSKISESQSHLYLIKRDFDPGSLLVRA